MKLWGLFDKDELTINENIQSIITGVGDCLNLIKKQNL